MRGLGITASGHRASDYASAVLADSPTAWWRHDEVSGATSADSAGANPATWAGTYTRGATPLIATGQSISLAGAGIGNTSWSPTYSALTLESIIRPSVVNQYMSILDRDQGTSPRLWQFRVTNTGTVQLIWWTTGGGPYFAASSTALTADTTYHVAATLDGSTGRVYINGVNDGATAQSGTPQTGSLQIRLGYSNDPGATTFGFRGLLDEQAVYSSALSGARILAHAQAAGLA